MSNEYFIKAQSFAAPFCSDESQGFISADSPADALEVFARKYSHPCGLYSAFCYKDANAEAKGHKPLAKWLCNYEAEKQRLTHNLGSYSFLHSQDKKGEFMEVDGKRTYIKNPRAGSVVT